MARMSVKYFVVDAFTDLQFKGNPAAVCLLEEERDEEWLQAVAREFNLSATCYLTKITDIDEAKLEINGSSTGTINPRFRLRWFAPDAELKICGHGTLATSHILFSTGLVKGNNIEFVTKSGVMTAKKVAGIEKQDVSKFESGETKKNFSVELSFPLIPVIDCDSSEMQFVPHALNADSTVNIMKMAYEGDLIVELSSGKIVADLEPSYDEIKRWPGRGVLVTGAAPHGSGFDFFSRFFCPNLGIKEDPVCGSAHCALAPYWSKKLGKSDLKAFMASSRGGILGLHVEEKAQRVLIQGKAITVMEGSLLD